MNVLKVNRTGMSDSAAEDLRLARLKEVGRDKLVVLCEGLG